MRNSDKLTSLIKRASLTIKTLRPTDVSEVKSLQVILDKINHIVAGMGSGHVELLEQANGATEAPAKVLQQGDEDSVGSVETVSQADCSFQNLTDQITQTGTGADSEPADTGLLPTVEPGPKEAAVIDKYKQTQNQLRESEEKYRTIFENSAVAIMMADEQERLVSWNKYTEKLLGMNAEDLHLKPVKSLYPDGEWVKIRSRNIRQKSFEAHLESKMIAKDGQMIEVDISLSVLRNLEGKVINSIAIIKDISDRKKSERDSIFAKKELEEANRRLEQAVEHANMLTRKAKIANNAKSEFLANMSHEIRTPMNGIVGMLTLALNKERDEKIREFLTIAKTCADNLLKLINDILDISKVEAGKLNVEIIDSSVSEILSTINSSMRPMATEKGISFNIVLKTDVPENIKTDPARLNQCLINLIGNAIKFTDTGGVTIELSLEKMGDKAFVRFDVVDTGIGIPIDKQQTVFDKFTQADGSTTRKHDGTGLGLAITKQLAELLGGDITLFSEPGKGSTFSLIILANIDTASATMISNDKWRKKDTTDESSDEISNNAGKILVVEDDYANQQVILGVLEETNLQAEIANDGIEAVDKVTSGSYDLIFMDMQMPNMNGYDATKLIRKKGYTVPIIALTAYAMKGDEEKCLNAGCDAYLPKPVDAEMLFKTLGEFLSFESGFMLDEINAAEKKVGELNKQFCNAQKATVKSINDEE
jgi:PAS domain S-box-containing protein